MEIKNARTSRVENYLNMLLTKYGVSDRIFISNLPVNILKEWNDFVLIDVGMGRDLGAYHSFSVNIFLYGRPIGQSQQKNVKVIDAMEEKMDKAIKEEGSKYYHLTANWRDADYDDTRNFHFNVINITLLAND